MQGKAAKAEGKVRSQIENKSELCKRYCCFVHTHTHTHVFRIDGEAGEKRDLFIFFIYYFI